MEILQIMFAFALVLVVAGSVALVWIISDLKQRTRALESSLSTCVSSCAKQLARLVVVEKQSPITLAAKVDELSEAVERLRKTHQRFAGRFDQFVHPQRREPVEEVDDELSGMLALQSAPPAGPNGGS